MQPKMRPYWHVDAKWVCGLFLLATLSGGLLLMSLAALTAPGRGVEFATTVIASVFSRDGLDAPIDTTDLRARLAASPSGRIAPLDGFPAATITAADLNLSPRELRLKIFRQIAAPIYEKGVEGAAKDFNSDPEKQKTFENDAFALSVFTRQTHDRLVRWGGIALGASAVLLLGVVYFSFGWGRLANPGLLLLIVALPGAVLSSAMLGMTGQGGAFGVIPAAVVPDLVKALRDIHAPVAEMGVVMLVVAAGGKLWTEVSRRRQAVRPPRS
jgi:hypothetical protein